MEYTKMIKQIKNNLIKSQNVRKRDENASDVMAISFIDIEKSNKKINFLINKLRSNDELIEEDINDILCDIGVEFRHVLYHIKDMLYYDYLDED